MVGWLDDWPALYPGWLAGCPPAPVPAGHPAALSRPDPLPCRLPCPGPLPPPRPAPAVFLHILMSAGEHGIPSVPSEIWPIIRDILK